MNNQRLKDEHIEGLYDLHEEGEDKVEALKSAMKGELDAQIIEALVSEEVAAITDDGQKISLTPTGLLRARRLIRAHRIAERLIYDVVRGEYESGACEFEHIVAPELVDSICTLLGHPRECPHGMPIPEGECCEQSSKTVERSVVPLTELEVGRSARVAYVQAGDHQRLHRIDSFQIRPGATVKVHQTYPSHVIECEGTQIAVDESIAAAIFVFARSPDIGDAEADADGGVLRMPGR